MDFKKKRLNKALEDKTYRVKLVHSKKGWLTIGLTFVTLFSATMLSQKTVDASAVNNVAVANSSNSTFVQLWSDVTSNNIHKANRGLGNGTSWKTAKAVKGVDGETYLLVGGNEYANANQMDLADETSKQDLKGIVLTNTESKLYTNPLAAGGPQLITNRGLGDNTAWKTDTKVVVDGQTYYRVATNEWIKASNVSLTSVSSRSEKTYTKNSPDAESASTNNENTNANNGSNGGSTTTPADPDKEVTITINYFKRSTTTNDHYILKTEKRKVKLNSNITIDAPKFDGYTVVPGEQHGTYKVLLDDEVFNVPYTKDSESNNGAEDGNGTIIIHHVKYDGSQFAPDEKATAKIGSNYKAISHDTSGWMPEKLTQYIDVQKGTNEITFIYHEDKLGTVKVNYVDENDKSIADSDNKYGYYGGQITIGAKNIAGYVPVGDNKQNIKVSEDGNSITFVYKKDDGKTPVNPVDPSTNDENGKFIRINSVDENGKTLVERWDMATIGKDVTFTAPEIDGYTAIEPKKTIFVNVNGDTIVNFVYKKGEQTLDPSAKTANVTVKYVDENGKEVAKSKTSKQEIGKEFITLAPNIAGYTLYSNTSDRIIVNEAGNTITFIYKSSADAKINLPADATANVTVMYKDENEIRIAKDKVTTEKVGSKVTAKAIDIPGYKLISIPTADLLVNPDVGNSTTFTYQKDSATTPETKSANVTVKYVDDQGKDVANDKTLKDQKVDSTISEGAIKIDGYTADQATKSVKVAADGSSVITFTYKKDAVAPKNATIITKFVDENGKEIANAKSDKAEIGKDFTAKAVDVDGYTVKGSATQTVTVSGDKTVTFTYTKNVTPVSQSTITTKYVDNQGKDVADATSEKIDNGKLYSSTAKTVKGYTLSGKATQTIDSVTGDATLTFTYTKNAPVQTVNTNTVSAKVISLVNNYRTSKGLKALNVDSNLSAGAVARSITEKSHVDASGDINSANHDEFKAQSQPDLQKYGSTNMAENLAVTSGNTADEVAQNLFNQWKNSPEHNKTMLDASMTDIGVGTQLLANGQYVAIQDFGSKIADTAWDASNHNSASLESLGYTSQDAQKAVMMVDGSSLSAGTGNYYIGNHVFKTQKDLEDWMDNPKASSQEQNVSIWTKGGVGTRFGYALISDPKTGASIGWIPYLTNMDKPSSGYISEGSTIWYN